MEMQVGYATLPTQVTYHEEKSKADDGQPEKIPEPYQDIWVVDDPFGEGAYLTFEGGQSLKEKNYALVQHKGTYVKNISFVSWESIPSIYRDKLDKD